MVEDMFAPRMKNDFPSRRREIEIIEYKEPIEKLVSDVKKALDEYNRAEENKLSIKILEGSREVGVLSQ